MSENSPRPDDARDPDPDRTVADGRPLSDDPDATQIVGPAGGDADATRAFNRDRDATQVAPAAADAWTGRAEVRPNDPVRGAIPPQDTEEWGETDDEDPGRRWWLPILLGLLGVLAVLGIITAIVLANRDNGGDKPAPGLSVTAGPTATTPASLSPSAAPSPSVSPSTAPTATTVLVPETQGETQVQATGKLQALGLVVHVTFQEDPVATEGTVLASVPTAGSVVLSGSDITLIIAKALPSSPPSPSPSPKASKPGPNESLSPGPENSPN